MGCPGNTNIDISTANPPGKVVLVLLRYELSVETSVMIHQNYLNQSGEISSLKIQKKLISSLMLCGQGCTAIA